MLAMFFLLFVSVLVVAMLSVSMAGTRSLRPYREQRVLRYNAEAAVNVTILKLARDPALATAAVGGVGCSQEFTMQMDTSTGARAVFETANNKLAVTCTVGADSGKLDTDDGQMARVVTIDVTCAEKARSGTSRRLRCGGSGATIATHTLATVQVRFEPDYTLPDTKKRAVVPKIVRWDTTR